VGKYKILDTSGDVCPVPLIKFRRSIDNLKPAEILVVTGTHDPSRDDIIKAAKELNVKVIKVEKGDNKKWTILVTKHDK
jgi:TusA-related sulfurtransferase